MRDYRQLLEGFIQGGKKEEDYIRKLVKQAISPHMVKVFVNRIGDDYEEEIISELKYRLIKQSEIWKSRPYISIQYLRSIIKNLVIDILKGEKTPLYSLQTKVFEEEGKSITYEDILPDTRESFAEAESNLLFEKLIKSIDERDIPVLCYYFNKHLYDAEIELKGISRDNLYKRWERLRKGKLREVFMDATHDEFRVAVERFLSEICKSRGYIK